MQGYLGRRWTVGGSAFLSWMSFPQLSFIFYHGLVRPPCRRRALAADPLPEANAAKDGADDADDETGSAEQGMEEVPAIVLNPEQPGGLVDLLPDFLADLSRAPPDFLVDLVLQLTTKPRRLGHPRDSTALSSVPRRTWTIRMPAVPAALDGLRCRVVR